QITLTLKAKPPSGYEGTILFKGQQFPLTASGDATQLSGTFQTDNGSFGFTVTREGDTANLATGGKTYSLKPQRVNPLGGDSVAANPLAATTSSPGDVASGTGSGDAPKGY